jgi:competence ComEA-like helix-hairpin-helix protein
MKLLQKFNQTFGFTPTESKVVFFLVAMFMIGIGVKIFTSGRPAPGHYDYSTSDSIFSARSAQKLSPETLRVKERTVMESSLGPPAKPKPRPIDINMATKEDLVALPGIGEAMAERIIMYREEKGPFRSVDDLLNVKGIGRKKLDRLAPYCLIRK